jgi:hypothetical protein
MYGFLTNALKRRVVRDLRRFIEQHPEFSSKLVVLPAFPMKDRPSMFVRVFGSTAEIKRLDPSNHVGQVLSHVQLLKVEHKPGTTIEWVREANPQNPEDLVAPGFYYVEVTGEKEITVSALLEYSEVLYREYVTGVSSATFNLSHHPVQGRYDIVRISGDSRVYMKEGEHFTLDKETGVGTMLEEIDVGGWRVEIAYLAPGEEAGPYTIEENKALYNVLQGVVLAIGRRAQLGDKQVVRVTKELEPMAEAIGGRWDLGLSFEVWALDADSTSEISDFLAITFWGELLELYANEGIELQQLDIGGEQNEVYDETTSQVWFTTTLSLKVTCDWEIHIPIPPAISALRGLTVFQGDDKATQLYQNIITVPAVAIVMPGYDFERIR